MLYPVVRFFAWIFVHFRNRIRVTGLENIPKTGGLIFCCNHISLMDPIVLGAASKRPICFMAKKELFKSKFTGWFFRQINAFPVDRGAADMQSYKKALSLLKDGKAIGIFAQGTRVKDADMKGAKAGTAMFALRANVPIVPVGVVTGYKWFEKVTVKFGEPLYLEEYRDKKIKTEVLNQVTEEVVQAINKLVS